MRLTFCSLKALHQNSINFSVVTQASHLNPLTHNEPYRGRTAPLTSKVAFYIFIQQILVLNILNMVYTLLFFSSKCSLFHNSNVFGSCIIHILYTGVLKLKKNNSGAKRLVKLVFGQRTVGHGVSAVEKVGKRWYRWPTNCERGYNV